MSETTFATALDTLGQLLPADPGRDAIHLATFALTSDEKVFPGQHIGIVDGKASTTTPKKLGIVDPFLAAAVNPGQMFWIVLYPRSITSLRHVWEHPDFPKERKAAFVDDGTKEASKRFLTDFAHRLFSYAPGDDESSYLPHLLAGLEYGGGFGSDIEYTDDVQPSDELYRHYSRFTGKPSPAVPQYFRCAC